MEPDFSVILPAHNEEGNLEKVVDVVRNSCGGRNFEIVIVNDASTDSTGKIAGEIAQKFENVKVVHRNPPNGFGLAVRSGFEVASGKILIPFMCDMQDDATVITKMADKANEGYDIVVASRYTAGGKNIDYPFVKNIANRLHNKFAAFLFGMETGDLSYAFKAYNKNLIKDLEIKSEWFEITSEIVLKALILKNAKIGEVPTTMVARNKGITKFKLFKLGKNYLRVLLEALKLRYFR